MTINEKQGTVYFPIVFHLHQPIGNLSWVFKEAYEKAYFPLIEAISKYPKIKVNLHITGPLLMWLKEHHPEYLERIISLYTKNQVEIIGGGFYEPILAIIPEEDRVKQIQMTIDWWKTNYNITPRGFWLAERVWVPDLPITLAKQGVEFVFIDDHLFKMAGFSEEDTFYTYNTEYQGDTVVVFPINEQIRYLVPWKQPTKTIKYLKKARDPNHEKIVVMISDAEKMGVWPAGDRTTHDICYISGYDGKQGWVYSFYEAILSHDWIKPVLISEYLEKHHPRGLIYLPTSSYDKMATWALPTPLRKRLEKLQKQAKKNNLPESEDILMFATGSIWQNFLVKYPQANVMHKRMLYCRNKLKIIEPQISNESQEKLESIWEKILASQSNDALWAGMFGGVYYRFLRQACLKHILQAESQIDALCADYNIALPTSSIQDVLLDGQPDGILENRNIACFISSLKGGTIFSLGLKPNSYDFLNVLKRYREAYHSKEVPAVNDRIEKWSFQDHFFQTPDSIEAYVKDEYEDLGDFANQIYDLKQNSDNSLTLERKALLNFNDDQILGKIIKCFSLNKQRLTVEYDIKLTEAITGNPSYFTPEMNFIGTSYPYKTSGYVDDQPIDLKETVEKESCQTFEIRDANEQEKVAILVRFPYPVRIITHPLMSIPKSEIGYEKQYQGTSLFPFFEIRKKNLTFQIEVLLNELE